MNAHPKKSDAKQAAFLAAYQTCGTVTGAATASGVSHRSHYRWLDSDADYADAFDDAKRIASESLEAEARRRAVDGVAEPIFHRGEVVGQRMRYSDTLLIFLLKGNCPEKFGDKVTTTHKGEAEAPVTIYELPANGREAPKA